MCDNSQSLGDFFVLQDGGIVPDFGVAVRKYQAAGYEGAIWEHVPQSVKYMACFWHTDNGTKTCVTDRRYNNIEVHGAGIRDVVVVLDQLTARPTLA